MRSTIASPRPHCARPPVRRTDRIGHQARALPVAAGRETASTARLTCPIGLPGIAGKEPEVIAVAAMAQLLAL
jgi:xanthine/CO dehydrogenase XdhC/CoxF family maturation factor